MHTHTLTRFFETVRRRHAIRQAEHRLATLDEHLLRDIGLDRPGIPGAIRHGHPVR